MKPTVCWLFCTVIDNFGDIGVSWRLARQLQTRLGAEVWLWLDDLAALRRMVPEAPERLPGCCAGIRLAAWRAGEEADLSGAPLPDLVIETFACDLPEAVRAIIRRRRPLWLNWEYLSAEDWAEKSHAMPSAQADGSAKYFWQMGFTERSGGLLREGDYAQRRRRFDEEGLSERDGGLKFYVFGYASPVWARWCRAWRQTGHGITLFAAGRPVQEAVSPFRQPESSGMRQGANGPHPGGLLVADAPFVPQQAFDEQLWAADVLAVRGEDSFVRAQLAGKPFFWHIYPQAQRAHLDKLDAFWRRYWRTVSAPAALESAHTALSQELNGGDPLNAAERARHWRTLLDMLPEWQRAAGHWRAHLFAQSDAVSRLARFMREKAA